MKSSHNGKHTTPPKAPSADIIINATPNELRIALIEEGRLAEIYLDVPDKQRTVGSIYLGRVQKVLQGMNAAFVDIGLEQDAFLHFSDVGSAFDEFREFLDGDDDDDEKSGEAEGKKEGGKGKKDIQKGKEGKREERKEEPKQQERPKREEARKPEVKRDDSRENEQQKESEEEAEEMEQPRTGDASDSEGTGENGEGRKKRRRGRRGGRRRRKQREGGEENGDQSQTEGTAAPPPAAQQKNENRQRRDGRDERRPAPRPEAAAPAGESAPAPRGGRNDARAKKSEAPAEIQPASQPAAEAAPAKRRASKQEVETAAESTPAKATTRRSTKKSEPVAEAGEPAPKRTSRKAKSEESPAAASEAVEAAPKRASRAKKATAEELSTEAPATSKRRSPRAKKNTGESDAPVRSETIASALPTFQTKRSGTITIALERGQDIMVQVTRESYSSKGVRVASKISLPGRFLVLLPLDPGIGISRKVQSEKERRRLRRIARSILPEGHGCIIRTVAEGREEEVIRQDLTTLVERWKMIEERVRQTEPPALLYRESSIAGSMMRDLLTRDVGRIMIDNREMYDALTDYVAWAAPWMVGNVHLHTGPQPIFEQYGVERELDRMMEPKIYTPSGGYIIIDRTEAMTVIDVNSGRFVGKKDQEQNALKTDLEAAREIARQLRLRDVGGLIVVDFIDLDDERNRKKVCDELKREMRNDKAKSVVLPMTQFGIVQMTRQRIRQQVVETLTQQCACCNGTGSLRSRSVAARSLERWLERFKAGSREKQLTLRANPDFVSYLSEGEGLGSRLTEIMRRTGLDLVAIPDPTLGLDKFHLISTRTGLDVTREFSRDKRGNTPVTPLPPYVLPPGLVEVEERREKREHREHEGEERSRGPQDESKREEHAKQREGRRDRDRRHGRDHRDRKHEPQHEQAASEQAAEAVVAPVEGTAQQPAQQHRDDRRRNNRRGGRGGQRREGERQTAEAGTVSLPETMPMQLEVQPTPSAGEPAPVKSSRGKKPAAKTAEPAVQASTEPAAEKAPRRSTRTSTKEKAAPKVTAEAQPEAVAEKPKRTTRTKKAAPADKAEPKPAASEPAEKPKRAPRAAATSRARAKKSAEGGE